jgi:hypothetical protein
LVGKYIYTPEPTPAPLPAEASVEEGDPTTNWKMYTNPQYPFSFKYPSDYKMEENPGYISVLSPLLPTVGKGYELKNGELKIEIYIQPSPVIDSLERYLTEKIAQT